MEHWFLSDKEKVTAIFVQLFFLKLLFDLLSAKSSKSEKKAYRILLYIKQQL
jgi:hypothetical protein